jgi:hypothetical protein
LRTFRRNAVDFCTIAIAILWAVLASTQVIASLVPAKTPDWLLPLIYAGVPTLLLVVAAVRHARGRPDLVLGDPVGVSQIVIRSHKPSLHSSFVKPDPVQWDEIYAHGFRLPVLNRGSAVDGIKVQITNVEPFARLGLSGQYSTRPLHIAGDQPPDWYTYRDSTTLNRMETEWYDLVAIGRMTLEPPGYPGGGADAPAQGFLYNIRGPGGVEQFRYSGDLSVTVTAFGGGERVSRVYNVRIGHRLLEVT